MTAARLPLATLLFCSCAATSTPPPVSAPTREATAERVERAAGVQSLGVFVGGSDEVGDRDGGTLGAEYTWWLGPHLGLGGFAEFVSGTDRSFASGAQVVWNPVAELLLFTGGGVERSDAEWAPIWRVGASYEIPVAAAWVLSPSISYDFAEGDNYLVYGLTVVYSW